MDIAYAAHSGLRYLVLLLGTLTLLWAALRWIQKAPYRGESRALLKGYAWALRIQFLLGLILLFTRDFYPALFGHIAVMFLAIGASEATLKGVPRKETDAAKHGRQLAGVGISLLLILLGIMAIGRGVLQSTI